jgi:hypothetical protein
LVSRAGAAMKVKAANGLCTRSDCSMANHCTPGQGDNPIIGSAES